MDDLESALKTLLDTVQTGSLFILDNLSFQTLKTTMIQRISPMKRASQTLIEDNERSEADAIIGYNTFIHRLLRLLSTYAYKLKIVIVASDLANLKHVIEFNKEIYIGPLSKGAAIDMIKHYTSTLKVYSHILFL